MMAKFNDRMRVGFDVRYIQVVYRNAGLVFLVLSSCIARFGLPGTVRNCKLPLEYGQI